MEVIRVPSGELAAELGGSAVVRGADEVEGEVADDGHVPGSVSLSEAGLVVAEDDVEHPMGAVLDPPMPADGLGGGGGGEAGGGDVVAGFGVGLAWGVACAALAAGLDADEAGRAGQAELAREAALAPQPADLAEQADGAALDAAMALVDGGVGLQRGGRGGAAAKAASTSPRRVGWLALTASAPLRPSPSARRASGAGIAASSFALAGTASWPSTRRRVVAKAGTKWIGPASAPRSWLRREALPPIATTSGRPGQASRTQALKAAENGAGLMRFIRMVSHRPPGTPCS
jgi:hypothetical protein